MLRRYEPEEEDAEGHHVVTSFTITMDDRGEERGKERRGKGNKEDKRPKNIIEPVTEERRGKGKIEKGQIKYLGSPEVAIEELCSSEVAIEELCSPEVAIEELYRVVRGSRGERSRGERDREEREHVSARWGKYRTRDDIT